MLYNLKSITEEYRKIGDEKMRIAIKNGYVITMDGQNRIFEKGDVYLEDNKIVYVGPIDGIDFNADKIIDANKKIVMPGFINSHTHTTISVAKGTLDKDFHALFMWRNMAATARRTPEEVYYGTLASCIEVLKGGATTLQDHFPEQPWTSEEVDAAAQAFKDFGIRTVLALRIYDDEYADIIPQNREILPADLKELLNNNPLTPPSMDETIEMTAEAIKKWHDPNGMLWVVPAPSAPLRCSDDFMRGVVKLADEYDVNIHTHLLESKIQSVVANQRYGKTLVAHMDDLGMLSSKLSCAHSVWVTDEDIKLMAERGVSVCHNPTSNLRLGVGICPVLKMQQAGVNVAVSTDGAATNDNLNMLEAMKMATILHRVTETDRSKWLSAEDALYCGTMAAAKAVGMNDFIGSLEVNKSADLVIYDMDTLAFKPLYSPLRQLIYSANNQHAETSIVNGEILMENGKLTRFEEDKLLDKLEEIKERLVHDNAEWFDFAERIYPYLIAEQTKQ